MKILIRNGRVMDPARGLDQQADVAIDGGKVLAIGKAPEDLPQNARSMPPAAGCCRAWSIWPCACASPATSTKACCSPRWLHRGRWRDQPGLARPTPTPCSTSRAWWRCSSSRAEKLHQSRLFPLGALTLGLKGEVLTEMAELTESGCIGFSQAKCP